MIRSLVLVLWYSTIVLHVAIAQTVSRRAMLPSAADSKLLCRITVSTTLEPLCIPILDDGTETDAVVPIDLPPASLDDASQRRLTTGSLYGQLEGASVSDDYQLDIASNATISILDNQPSNVASIPLTTTGIMTVMIVRVTSKDGIAPAASLNEIRQRVLGSGASMATQYKSCSFGKLQFREARSLEITLPREGSYYRSPAELAAATQERVMDILNVDSMSGLADKIIFCQPPDKLGWTSVAVVNHWRINMKDAFCTSLSSITHEVGHSLGLFHSGVGSQPYGDYSGYMGISYMKSDWPLMCFNGVKNSQLGWYSNRKLTIDPFAGSVKVKLAAFVDYAKTIHEPVLIKVGDYALQYNLAKGINVGTQAKANLVTITQDATMYSKSVAGLGAREQFTVPNYQGSGKTLFVKACRLARKSARDIDMMVISIGIGESLCGKNTRATDMSTRIPACRSSGKYCSANGDCCNTLKCMRRANKPNKCSACRAKLRTCISSNDCCGGLSCTNKKCV